MKRILTVLAVAALSLQALAQEVNIGSFNIRLLTKSDSEHNDHWEQRRDMVCELIAFLDYDAFGAQEVTNPQLVDMLERLPEYSYVGVGRDDGDTKGEYSPIFYNTDRFRLMESGTFWFSETPDEVSYGWDAACRRVCSYALFRDRHSRKQFWFFNAHLDHKGVEARRESVRLMLRKISELAGDEANVIVTGDFNVNQFSEAYETMLSTDSLVDAYAVAERRFAPGGTFNGWDAANYSQSRIDHVFVSSDAMVRRYGVVTAHYWLGENGGDVALRDAPSEIKSSKREVHMPSDHYPVCVKLEFTRRK